MTTPAHYNVEFAVKAAGLYLQVYAKSLRPRRDKREPDRLLKEELEGRIAIVLRRHFNRQKSKIILLLETGQITQNIKATNPQLDDIFELDDEDLKDVMQIMRLLLRGSKSGIDQFGKVAKIDVDWSAPYMRASKWASKYAFDFIKGINDKDRELVRQAIQTYIETPGYTRGDLIASLPYDDPVRSERIAVTEVTRAYANGQQQAGEYLKEQYPDVKVVKLWFTNRSDRTCDLCLDLEGAEVEIDQNFYEPESDYEDGNPPRHVNCLTGDAAILSIGGIAGGSERWYEGDIVIIKTLENQLAITPNHPILTPLGWMPARLLQKGSYIWGYSASEWEAIKMDNQNGISTIKDIFGSLGVGGLRVPTSAPDFHGDGIYSKIATIRPNGKIVNRDYSQLPQPASKYQLATRNVITELALSSDGALTQFVKGDLAPATSIVGGLDLSGTLGDGHSLPADKFRLGLTARGDTSLDQSKSEGTPIDPEFLRKCVLALPGFISIQEVIEIGYEYSTRHVYNLQTETGLFVADGIITHNCYCWTESMTRIEG